MKTNGTFKPVDVISLTVAIFATAIIVLIKASLTSTERAQTVGNKVISIIREQRSHSGSAPYSIVSGSIERISEHLYSIDGYNVLYMVTSDTNFTVSVIIDDTEQTTYESTTGTWK